MDTAVITLSPPQEYDLQSLAQATRESLALLKPWTKMKQSSSNPLAANIVAQASKYVSAIQMGVSAAYSGFTVTEEILFLATALPVEDSDDLQRYLVGMWELAKEARKNANNAHEAFRNVRQEIYGAASRIKVDRDEKELAIDLPEHHRKDMDVLVKFADHISTFANWWDWVKIETDPSRPDQPISFQIDALKDPEVVKRWSHLRSQYKAYVQLIGEMEDADPQFFSRSWADNTVAADLDESVEPKSPPTQSGHQTNEAPLPTHTAVQSIIIQESSKELGSTPNVTLKTRLPDTDLSNSPRTRDKVKSLHARFKIYWKKQYPRLARVPILRKMTIFNGAQSPPTGSDLECAPAFSPILSDEPDSFDLDRRTISQASSVLLPPSPSSPPSSNPRPSPVPNARKGENSSPSHPLGDAPAPAPFVTQPGVGISKHNSNLKGAFKNMFRGRENSKGSQTIPSKSVYEAQLPGQRLSTRTSSSNLEKPLPSTPHGTAKTEKRAQTLMTSQPIVSLS